MNEYEMQKSKNMAFLTLSVEARVSAQSWVAEAGQSPIGTILQLRTTASREDQVGGNVTWQCALLICHLRTTI